MTVAKTKVERGEAARDERPKGFYLPPKLAGSRAWQALSVYAHRIFGVMYSIRARKWREPDAAVFELNYGELANKDKYAIDKNWIGPAERELEAAGIIERVRKGYGGPINCRSGNLFRFTYLDDGHHAFEEERSVKEWKQIFAKARADKDTAHIHPRKQTATPSGLKRNSSVGDSRTRPPLVASGIPGQDPPFSVRDSRTLT
jgi:hypothetical protein